MVDAFIVAQKAAIKQGNKYLIVKRSPKEDTYQGFWEFPGGKLNKEEEPQQGVEREVMEETKLKVKAIKPIFVFKKLMPNGLHYLFIVYLCKKLSGSIRLSEEHDAYRWASRQELHSLELHPFLKAFLENGSI